MRRAWRARTSKTTSCPISDAKVAPPANSMGASVALAASGTDWLASKPAAMCGDEGARPICKLPPVVRVGVGLKVDGGGGGIRVGTQIQPAGKVGPAKSAVAVRRGAVTLSLVVKKVPEPCTWRGSGSGLKAGVEG